MTLSVRSGPNHAFELSLPGYSCIDGTRKRHKFEKKIFKIILQVSQLREAISFLPNVSNKCTGHMSVPSTVSQEISQIPRTGTTVPRTVPLSLSSTPTVHAAPLGLSNIQPVAATGKPSLGYISGTIRSSLIIKTKE